MSEPTNPFKTALNKGELKIGLWLTLANAYAAEAVATTGFDWLVIDGEHSPNTLDTILAQLQALAPYPVEPVVRVSWNDPVEMKRVLDIGARTVLVPVVQNGEEARRAVAATRYPPQGIRGMASAIVRASRWNTVPNYAKLANDLICLLVQVETRAGLAKLEEICAVDGVDGVFIGPADLAADFGLIGQLEHPDVLKAIEDAIRRIRKAGKAAGVLTGNEALAKRFIELGANFTAVGTDVGLLTRQLSLLASRFKQPA